MHYPKNAFAKEEGLLSITFYEPVQGSQATTVSKTDIEALNIMYPPLDGIWKNIEPGESIFETSQYAALCLMHQKHPGRHKLYFYHGNYFVMDGPFNRTRYGICGSPSNPIPATYIRKPNGDYICGPDKQPMIIARNGFKGG